MLLIFIISGLVALILLPFFYKKVWLNKKSIALLPTYSIYFGIIILVGCTLLPIFLELKDNIVINELRYFLINIGLLVIAFSKERDENADYNDKRFLSFFISFVCVCFVYEVFLIFDIQNAREISGVHVSLWILSIYLFIFHINKKSINK